MLLALRQLPDIMTSATFWASVGTLWAAAGAWFAYVAAAVSSRQEAYQGVLNLIAGLEAELHLVSEWAAGDEGNQGYLSKTTVQLVKEHPDWFNPSRSVFTFSAPTLGNLTNSPHAKSLAPVIRPLVMLNHSIRRIFDTIGRYQAFVMGSPALYQSVLPKFATPMAPAELGSSKIPDTFVMPPVHQIAWTPEEQVYINLIFMMNESIHQHLIGGADCPDEVCLYKAFRKARAALQEFKQGLKREPLPDGSWVLHIVAGCLALNGLWQVLRWFEIL